MCRYHANAIISTGYIGEFEIVDDHRSGKIVVQLNGRLNKTGVISPRYNVQVNQIEAWVNLLLPARSFGKLILVSNSKEALVLDCVIDLFPPVDHIIWYPRPRGGSPQERWWQDSRLRLLDVLHSLPIVRQQNV